MIFDISRELSAGTVVWPGDQSVQVTRNGKMEVGDSVNLGSLLTSLHAGTHVDAPFHFGCEYPTIEKISLETFLGTAVVVQSGQFPTIDASSLEKCSLDGVDCVLLKTNYWPVGAAFPHQIPVVNKEFIEILASHNIRLFGVDLPSVDDVDSKDLLNHHLLFQNGIHILESTDLSSVEEGKYEIIALPLKIKAGDASPVRAVLRLNC